MEAFIDKAGLNWYNWNQVSGPSLYNVIMNFWLPGEDTTTALPFYKKKTAQDQTQSCLCGEAEHDNIC